MYRSTDVHMITWRHAHSSPWHCQVCLCIDVVCVHCSKQVLICTRMHINASMKTHLICTRMHINASMKTHVYPQHTRDKTRSLCHLRAHWEEPNQIFVLKRQKNAHDRIRITSCLSSPSSWHTHNGEHTRNIYCNWMILVGFPEARGRTIFSPKLEYRLTTHQPSLPSGRRHSTMRIKNNFRTQGPLGFKNLCIWVRKGMIKPM